MHVQPYLFFDGRCDEALDFYKKTLGATVNMLMRFKESPDQTACAPGSEEKVMHACFNVGDTAIFASDGMNKGKPNFDGFSLSVTGKDGAEVETLYNALVDGGEAVMPPGETFFAHKFGMLKDKFGVRWMVLAPKM